MVSEYEGAIDVLSDAAVIYCESSSQIVFKAV